MKYEIKLNDKQLDGIINELNFIIGSIDRIGSGFEGVEETSLALLLFFNKTKCFDKLSKLRLIIHREMERQLSVEDNENATDREADIVWKPPYTSSKEELLKMLEEEQ